MSCIIASNQPIYQALLEKAKSYPEDKVYQKNAYENAAKNLLTHSYDIYQGDGQDIPGVGTNILNFIKDFIKTEVFPSGNEKYAQDAMEEARRLAAQNAPKVEPQPEQKPEGKSCKIASNQPIYQALIEKANSYSEDKVYQKKAYKNVAKNLLTFEKNLYSLYYLSTHRKFLVPGAGESILEFIREFIAKDRNPPSLISTKSMDDVRELAKTAQRCIIDKALWPFVYGIENPPKPEPKSEPEQKYTQNAMKDVNSVTLPGPPLTTTITYITIETTQSLDDIMKCIKAMNVSVTINPPK